MRSKRELFWDIIKGIGIVSIVLGHVIGFKVPILFVYMYHLAIFYFVSSYFYNEDKYGDNPGKNFLDKLKPNWLKYISYSMFFLLLHNVFVKYNFLESSIKAYSIFEFIPHIINTLIFNSSELFAGAMWFLPTLIFSLTIFGIIVYLSRKVSNIVHKEKKKKIIKYVSIIISSVVAGMVGVFLNINKIPLLYHLHISFLVIPICCAGYFLRKYKNIIKIIKKSYVAIPTLILTAGIILYAVIKKGYQIELSAEMIINGYMFYIISFVGILFCLSLAAIIEKIPILNKGISILGKYSFSIMALHFVSVKLVDIVYCKLINQTNPEIISKWVVSYPKKLWIVYVIVGCLLPILISILLEKTKVFVAWKFKIKETEVKKIC